MDEVVVVYGHQAEKMAHPLIEKAGSMDQLRPDESVMIKPKLRHPGKIGSGLIGTPE